MSALLVLLLFGQQPVPAAPKTDSVVVTGVYEPVPLDELDRAVRAIVLDDAKKLLSNTVFDFLRLDPSLDLRARAPNGVQTDLSIRGASFGQTLVLLDGLRLNDAQSGHHSLDIPVPPDALDRVEILKGAGSAFYGSDAIGGAVNLITRAPEAFELRLRTAAGNFGVNQQSGTLSLVPRRLSQEFSFSRDFSHGFRDNRDYRNLSMASHTRWRKTSVLLAHNDRPFGADQFYGNFNSWERTRTWFAGARQGIGERTHATLSYRRHTDLFVLYRDRPEVFTNRHASENYQAAIRRQEAIRANVTASFGGEFYRDAVESTNLGQHDRNRGAIHAALDVRALRRFSFTAGAREEFFAPGGREFNPTISAGLWAGGGFKLRASVSRAFRVPSYTDLYYHDPANRGSPDLQPERAWSYDGGLQWSRGGRWRAETTIFHRRERDGIDYVRRSPAEIWRATNISRLNFTGVEASVTARLRSAGEFEWSYTGLRGARDALAGYLSKYVFNYPSHNGVFSWQGELPGRMLARTRVGALKRLARDPYAVWDVYAGWRGERFRPFFQLTNLTSMRYEEIVGVAAPGRAAIMGLEWRVR